MKDRSPARRSHIVSGRRRDPRWPAATALAILGMMLSLVANAQTMNFEQRCHQEVVALHETIEAWLAGALPDTDEAFARFSDAMADDFEIISPAGTRADRDAIIASLRAAHGVQRADFTISIRNVRTRLLAPPLALVTYEEWQSEGEQTTARFSSVLMREDAQKPGGVGWVHLQETWLPGSGPQ